ncbi:MAG: hypothetical protein N3A62_00885 [Thermodesulfovibrionales bacterium]|nr:hypothetical protein [Thermodesulfovibrionales bacterium]
MKSLFVLFLVLIIGVSGCGKKTQPSLKPYEPPPSVKTFYAIMFEDSIIINWDYHPKDRERLEGFIIKRSYDNKKTEFKVSAVSNQFIDTDIKEKEVYKYSIYGVNKRGITGLPSNEISVKVCPMPNEKIHPNYRVYNDYIEIIWDAPSSTKWDSDCPSNFTYNIYKSDYKDNPSSTPINPKTIKNTSFKLEIPKEEVSYYHIRPVVETNIIQIGKVSNPLTISLSDLIPSKIEGIKHATAENRIFITWKESPETWVKGYKVYRMFADGIFKEIAFVNTPVFTEMATEKLNHYKISAVGPQKEGIQSDIITIKVK